MLALCRRDGTVPSEPAAGFDWAAAQSFASRHRLGPSVYWRLREQGFPAVPADVREAFEKTFRATIGTNLAYVCVFLTLLERLEARSVRVIALKGPVAAYVQHGNLSARQFGDLDLLVPRAHATEALDELRDLGFVPEVRLGERHLRTLLRTGRRELKVTHPTGWVVDLHWESLGAHFAWCREDELWDRSAEVDFEGRPVRTLGDVDLALYYCLRLPKMSGARSISSWTQLGRSKLSTLRDGRGSTPGPLGAVSGGRSARASCSRASCSA